MAVVTTSVTPTQFYFPFTGFTEPFAERSSDARAEIIGHVAGGSITLSGVGDTQRIIITMDMPLNYAYVLTDLVMELVATAADVYGFALQAQAQLLNATAAASINIPIGLTADGVAENAVTTDSVNYRLNSRWSGVLLPETSQDQVRLQVVMANPTTNQGAYTLNFSARFLQYDINQAHDLRVNTPIPTR